MTQPETLRGFDRQIAAAIAREDEVIRQEPATLPDRIAYWRDLIAAREAVRDLYLQAMNVATGTGLVWHALYEAADSYERRIAEHRNELAYLLERQAREEGRS